MRLWLSGAGGFIGHHVLEGVLTSTDWTVDCTDSFRHKGTTDRITQVLDPHPEWRDRVRVVTHDLAAPFTRRTAGSFAGCDYMIAMASESHVDRSISDPVPFVTNNVQVILNTLELARQVRPKALIVISTDEVYGPVERRWQQPEGMPPMTTTTLGRYVVRPHKEWSPIVPSNPYAASKAAQEAIAVSYWRTYSLPVTIVNCMNLFGERQDPEKYLPMLISRISRGETVSIHGTPGNVGTRHYLHARNLADALCYILTHLEPEMFGRPWRSILSGGVTAGSVTPPVTRPNRWNIAGPDATSNLDLARVVADLVGKPLRYELVDFHSARPGHDPHYGLDPGKLTAAGWKPPVDFIESLERTVSWALRHPEWI